MKRPAQVTLQLTLNLPTVNSRIELKHFVDSQIRQTFGSTLFDSPDSIQWISVRDPERQILTQRPHLDSILTNFGSASVVWCVEDVLEVRPDLTHEQAAMVLDTVRAKHEANCGIGWDTLEHFAESLFGEAPHSFD